MDFDQIDLGLNDEYVDHCDYIDYNKLVTDKNKGANTTFTVLQLNTRGVLNKRDSLNLLLNDIKKDSRVDVMETYILCIKQNLPLCDLSLFHYIITM